MTKVKKIVNFNDEELKIIKDDISTIYQKGVNSPFKRLFISNKYKIFSYIILILGVLLFISGCVYLILLKETLIQIQYLPLILIGLIMIIIGAIFLAIGQILNKKTKDAVYEHNAKYIKMAVHNAFEQLEINHISEHFTIVPQKFLIFSSSINKLVSTEKVLVGSVNNQDFNCGTMLEKIINFQMIRKIPTIVTTYNRYLYFTCNINAQDIIATIKPQTLTTSINHSTEQNQLQWAEFEKLFSLYDNEDNEENAIRLRKLLVPRVMNYMIDLATDSKPLPYIFISETQVTLMFPYMKISSPANSSANLLNLITKTISEEQLLNNIFTMLDFTLNIIASSYAWISSLDLNPNLVNKN